MGRGGPALGLALQPEYLSRPLFTAQAGVSQVICPLKQALSHRRQRRPPATTQRARPSQGPTVTLSSAPVVFCVVTPNTAGPSQKLGRRSQHLRALSQRPCHPRRRLGEPHSQSCRQSGTPRLTARTWSAPASETWPSAEPAKFPPPRHSLPRQPALPVASAARSVGTGWEGGQLLSEASASEPTGCPGGRAQREGSPG